MLTRDLLRLGEKALGLARLRHIGSNAAGPGTEVEFVVGAHGCASSQTGAKPADFRLWCWPEPSNAKALRKIAARGVKKWGAARGAPKQCADNNNFRNRPDVVPVSFILPSAFSDLSALPTGNAARRDPA
jgi:hypothetical protein